LLENFISTLVELDCVDAFMDEEFLKRLDRVKEFKTRLMIMGFSGWPDAGKVSSLSIKYLVSSLKAERIGSLKISRCYELTSTRPLVAVSGGVLRDFRLPSNDLYLWTSGDYEKAFLILMGSEPNMNWEEYANQILSICDGCMIRRIYLIGGVLDLIPHTRKPRIKAVVNMERLKREVEAYGLKPIEYYGPASIHSCIMTMALRRNIEAIGVWGHSPSYITIPNPKAALHVLRVLSAMLDVKLDLGDLERRAMEFEREVDEAVERNLELQRLVKELERSYDEELGAPPYIA